MHNKLYIFKGVCYQQTDSDPDWRNFTIDYETFKVVAENKNEAIKKLLSWIDGTSDETFSYADLKVYEWTDAIDRINIII